MDKYDYEERYGEKVIYCNRHRMSGIDGCIACDEEEQQESRMVTICITCRYESEETEDFVMIPIAETGKVSPVCQGCYDNYMVEVDARRAEIELEKAERVASIVNTDYLD